MAERREGPPDWLVTEKWHGLRLQISPSGRSETAAICGRCGSIVFDVHKPIHDEFHARLVEDPRYPYDRPQAHKVNGEPVYADMLISGPTEPTEDPPMPTNVRPRPQTEEYPRA